MKYLARIAFMVLLLTAIIVFAGVFTNGMVKRDSDLMERYISNIENYIKNEEWEKAETELRLLNEYWSNAHRYWSIFQNHFEIDNIDGTLSRAAMFLSSRDYSSSLAEISLLRHYIQHIPNKIAFKLENIL
mgnify:CR=1 FL=1